MDPAPRPPSPSAHEAIQMALRRENTEQLSKRDTLILGFNAADVKDGRARMDSFSRKVAIPEGESNPSSASSPMGSVPLRLSWQLGRMSSVRSVVCFLAEVSNIFFSEHLRRSRLHRRSKLLSLFPTPPGHNSHESSYDGSPSLGRKISFSFMLHSLI